MEEGSKSYRFIEWKNRYQKRGGNRKIKILDCGKGLEEKVDHPEKFTREGNRLGPVSRRAFL